MEGPLEIDHPCALQYAGIVKPGTYEEIMGRIRAGKKAELVHSARLGFSQKLALSAAASRSEQPLTLAESFAHPILEIIRLFNLGLAARVFDRYALAGGLAVEYYGAPINTVDADFLVVFPQTTGGLLDPSSFFDFFRRHGAVDSGEYLVLHERNFR